jgi:hypothetical protein
MQDNTNKALSQSHITNINKFICNFNVKELQPTSDYPGAD